jgi:hypothetical protein
MAAAIRKFLDWRVIIADACGIDEGVSGGLIWGLFWGLKVRCLHLILCNQ